MTSPPSTQARRRRSRIFLTLFLLAIVALSITAALLIQRGLGDEDLQQQLRDLREDGR
jgi:cell division protein FtsB